MYTLTFVLIFFFQAGAAFAATLPVQASVTFRKAVTTPSTAEEAQALVDAGVAEFERFGQSSRPSPVMIFF